MKKIPFILGLLFLAFFIIIIIPESRTSIRTKHFTFFFSNSVDKTKISVLSDALESNYLRIGKDLRTTQADNIEINIYAHKWRYIRATKNWSGSENIEGISKLYFVEQALGRN